VPEETVTVAAPSHEPLHVGEVVNADAVNVFHEPIVIVSFCVQPAASVIVTVYVPIHCEEIVAVVCPPGAHR
jgi:hypothetical protein